MMMGQDGFGYPAECCHLIKGLPLFPGKAIDDSSAQGRGVLYIGTDDRRVEQVGLKLHEELVLRWSAIGTDFKQATSCSLGHHANEVSHLIGN